MELLLLLFSKLSIMYCVIPLESVNMRLYWPKHYIYKYVFDYSLLTCTQS